MNDPEIVDHSLDHLFPSFRAKVIAALAEANRQLTIHQDRDGLYKEFKEIRLFEGFRSQKRQLWLYGQGRPNAAYGRPGSIVTNAKTSPYHNRGIAADCVPVTADGEWSWDWPNSLWETLAHCAAFVGLEAGFRWETFPDSPHIQIVKAQAPAMFAEIDKWKKATGLV